MASIVTQVIQLSYLMQFVPCVSRDTRPLLCPVMCTCACHKFHVEGT